MCVCVCVCVNLQLEFLSILFFFLSFWIKYEKIYANVLCDGERESESESESEIFLTRPDIFFPKHSVESGVKWSGVSVCVCVEYVMKWSE